MKSVRIFVIINTLLVLILGSCKLSQPYAQGKILYENFCQNCHQETGEAIKRLIPPLANSDYLVKEPSLIPCIIRYGLNERIVVNGVVYEQPMPAVPELSDVEITNIINYINHSWGNNGNYTSLEEVQEALEQCN